jgi:hypothetical protein
MKNIFILFLFLINLLIAQGQVPGYMGKRFSVFAEGNPTPALLVFNANGQSVVKYGDYGRGAEKNQFSFNFRPQITVEYLVHRDISIGLSYSRLMMGTVRQYSPDPLNPEFKEIDLDVIKGQGAGLHVKWYKYRSSGSIAPIGFYRTLSVYYAQTNTYDTKKSTTKQFENDFLYPVATLGIGRQSMLLKNLILKTGVELGWAFVPTNFLQEAPDAWTDQEFAGYNVHQSLAGYYMFNINLAIGYTFF